MTKMIEQMKTRLLTTCEASEYLNLSKATLETWRVRGGGPAFRHLGRLVRYHIDDLDKFASSNVRENTSK